MFYKSHQRNRQCGERYIVETDLDTSDFIATVELDKAVSFASKLVPRLVRPPDVERAICGVVRACRSRDTHQENG